MPVKEIPGYRVECDAEGCNASAQDGHDYAFWMQRFAAVGEAAERGWYVVDTGNDHNTVLLCPDHAPRCSCEGCDACERDCLMHLLNDDYGSLCEDCWLEHQEADGD